MTSLRHGLYVWAPAIISVIAYLVLDLIVRTFVGRPEDFPGVSGYRMTMNAAVILRMGPVLFSGLLVWPAMRNRGAGRWGAALGTAATPTAYAIVSSISALTFFPPLDALYYATNPMVMAAFGSQVSSAGVGALVGRWHGAGWRTSPVHWWSWGALAAIVIGSGIAFASVIWEIGRAHV